MNLKQNMSTTLLFVLDSANKCGIDIFHTDKIEKNSFSLHASGSGTPIKTGLNEQAPNHTRPDSRETCNTGASSESHIHYAS